MLNISTFGRSIDRKVPIALSMVSMHEIFYPEACCMILRAVLSL